MEYEDWEDFKMNYLERDYYGTYKMGNGQFFEVYQRGDGTFEDLYGTEISRSELKKYTKVA